MRYCVAVFVVILFLSIRLGAETVSWEGGGDGFSWHDPLNWDGSYVPTSTNDVVIDFSGDLTVVCDGNVTIRSIVSQESLTITNGTFTVTAGESTVAGTLSVRSGRTLTVSGADAKFTATGPVLADGARLFARNGAELSLPGLATFQDTSGCCGTTISAEGAGSVMHLAGLTNLVGNPTWAMEIRALSGGRMNLDNLKRIEVSHVRFRANGDDSLVHLPVLDDFPGTGGRLNFQAQNGGEVHIPMLTEADRTDFTRTGGGLMPMEQLTRIELGSITINAGLELTLPVLTNANGADFNVSGGATLLLPALETYTDNSGCCGALWQANGEGSLIELPALTTLTGNPTWAMAVRTSSGGLVDLPNLEEITSSRIQFRANDEESVINLSGLTEFGGTSGALTLEANNGGLITSSNLTSGMRVHGIVRSGGQVPLTQFDNLILGSITVEDGRSLEFPLVTNMNGAALTVRNGSSLSFPAVTEYRDTAGCCGTVWLAHGTGSVLAFPALTALRGNPTSSWAQSPRAQAGGRIELPLVENVTEGAVAGLADGEGSLIHFGSLQGLGHSGTRLEARNSGRIHATTGTLTITNSQVIFNSGGEVEIGALELYSGSALRGDGVFDAAVLNFAGTVYPGASAGELTIAGDYTQGGNGRLFIEIGGTVPVTEYDVLNVTGSASLDGTLEVRRINSFVPEAEDSFIVMQAGSISGEFSGYTGLDAGNNLEFAPVTSETEVFISMVFSTGPSVIDASPSGMVEPGFSQFTVIFSEPILHWTATVDDFVLEGPGGLIEIGLLRLTPTAFRVSFAPQTIEGTYTLTVGPDIRDLAGNPMNQNGNDINGEPDDHFIHTVELVDNQAPFVVAFSPQGYFNTDVSSDGSQVTFNKAIDPDSFTAADISIVTPSGALASESISVTPADATTFLIGFPTQTGEGIYEISIGPEVSDVSGNPMDAPFVTSFTIDKTSPRVLEMTPSGTVKQTVSKIEVLFDSAIDPASVTTGNVVLTGPEGSVAITGFSAPAADRVEVRISPLRAVGTYTLSVGPDLSDPAGNLLDQDGNGIGGEPSDLFTGIFTIILPDLLVTDIVGPESAVPGEQVELSYTITNQGNADVTQAITETVSLSEDDVMGDDYRVAVFTDATPIPAGGFLVRTQTVTIPVAGPAGLLHFVVEADSTGNIDEADETNNIAMAEEPIHVPAALTLQTAASSIPDNAADPNIPALVTRNGDTSEALEIELQSSDPSKLTVPANVTIPAGQNSAAFSITVVPSEEFGPHQFVSVTAGTEGFLSAEEHILVINTRVPALGLSIENGNLVEGESTAATVTRPVAEDGPLTVYLASSSLSQLSAPPTVVIPENEISASFLVTAVDDTLVEVTRGYTVTASAEGYLSIAVGVTIIDNDTPEITLELSAEVVMESAGSAAVSGTVTRSFSGVHPLVIALESSDSSKIQAPSTVVIPAGAGSATFPLSVVDNDIIDGDQVVTVSAFVTETIGGGRLPGGVSQEILVIDDDGPALRLVIEQAVVSKGASPATTATVTRNVVSDEPLVVMLESSLPAEAAVPATVTIPADQASAVFEIDSLEGLPGKTRTVTVMASAPDFASGFDTLIVTDSELPDLVISSVTVPANGLTESYFTIGYRESNIGLGDAAGSWSQRVYLSTDPFPGDDLVLGEFDFSGTVPPGLFFERTLQFRLPKTPGNYWIIVESDPNNTVEELREDNNITVSSIPIEVGAAYTATVETALDVAPSGTPVPLTGSAIRADTGGPAPFELVNIHIKVRDTRRVISALTDAGGNFSATFHPLPGEAGNYVIGAAHPGLDEAPAQDAFTLVGMRFEPREAKVKVIAEGSSTLEFELANQSDVALTGLVATLLGGDAAVEVSVEVASELPGSETIPLTLTVTSLQETPFATTAILRLTSTEGAEANLPIEIAVESLKPRLVATPGTLVAGMVRGEQRILQFTVENQGGAATGPVAVLVPGADFLYLASPPTIASLDPGDSAAVTLQLIPSADTLLGEHRGTIALSSAQAGLSVPFNFRALSDGVGDLVIEATDEYTYYAEGAPRVAGAEVTLSDAISGDVIISDVTGADGYLTLSDVQEGYYTLEVRAERHSTFRETVLVLAGQENEVRAFLSRQTVRYIWTVEPTEIEDRTRIVIETEFETFVPIPVITVDPPLIDLAEITQDVTQIDLKIENHGLIAADDMRIHFGSHPDWKFEPLVTELGTLPARSSFTVPLIIRRTGPSAGGMEIGLASGGGCAIPAAVRWTLVCGGVAGGYGAPISIQNVGGGCGGGVIYAAGAGGGAYTPPRAIASPTDCKPCDGDVRLAVAKCLFSFFPLDCPGSIVVNAADCAIGCAESGLNRDCAIGCAKAGVGTFLGCATKLHPGISLAWNGLNCVNDIFQAACQGSPGLESVMLASRGSAIATPLNLDFSLLSEHAARYRVMLEPLTELLGDRVWLSGHPDDGEVFVDWMSAYLEAQAETSEEGEMISESERDELLAIDRPRQITDQEIHTLVNRWNRTVEYWSAGIFNLADVPAGQSTNFIAIDVWQAKLEAGKAAALQNEAEGFIGLNAGLEFALRDLAGQLDDEEGAALLVATSPQFEPISLQQGGVCATVRLQIEQEAVITRDAFNATLELVNGSDDALEEVHCEIIVQNENGEIVTGLFGIRPPVLSGLSGVTGTGTVTPGDTGRVRWTIIPTSEAAPSEPLEYFVSGHLRYIQDGRRVNVPLAPVGITVHPSASLQVRYFHQRDVFSDDPFTPEIEPSIPFSLAVMVKNRGQGVARNVRITSSQPKIIENEKGLLIDFDIIATEVAGQNLSPSLTVNFGDIDPNDIVIGRWLLKSTLHGAFIDYSATFEHLDSLGDPRLSLIESVSIHELIHVVRAGGPFEDGLPDFLVNDFPDERDLPDTLYLSNGAVLPVSAVTTGTVDAPPTQEALEVQLSANMPGGWAYLRVPEPGNGQFRLSRVVRSDGPDILMDSNAWTTDRTFIVGGRRPLNEHTLHLLDYNSTGSYTLIYEPLAEPDTVPPASMIAVLPPESYEQVPLQWSGSDNPGGSGLSHFDIFVSVNGGPFSIWLERTTLDGAIFPGEIGNSYAFYSVAVDMAGNREEPPSTPEAQTTVSLVNTPPILTVGADQSVDEGATVIIDNSAIDAETPSGELFFSLGAGSPPGAVINPTSGRVTWPTSEAIGPSTNSIVVIVTDNGFPTLSATGTVTVVVNEVNHAPVLASISDAIINEGQTLSFTVNATDPDIPPNLLIFSLGEGAPDGASIAPFSGLFTWTPNELQGPSTNLISVIVTDNGVPSLSATQTFTVIVRDTLGDFVLSAGRTNLFAGETGSVPIRLESGLDISSLVFLVEADETYLADLAVQHESAEILSSSIQPAGPNLWRVQLGLDVSSLGASVRDLVRLDFATGTNGPSAIVPLGLHELVAERAGGDPLTDGQARAGRVIVVEREPVLEVGELPHGPLILYSHPGRNFILQSTPVLGAGADWETELTGAVNDRIELLHPVHPASAGRFYRVLQEPGGE